MRIVILSTKVPYPPRDGGAIATLNLAESLADQGNEVSMLCLNTNKHHFDIQNIENRLKEKISFYAIDHNTNINYLKLILNFFFSSKPYNSQRFVSVKFKRKLLFLLQEIKPDIIQMEGPYLNYCVPMLKKFPGITISLRAHNIEHEIWKRKASTAKNRLMRSYYQILSRRIFHLEAQLLKHIDLLVSISDRDREKLIQIHSVKSINIPTGLDLSHYPTPLKPATADLFFIGALDWQPNTEGIEWFIRTVYSKLRMKIPEASFHIAGRNASEALKKRLLSLNDQGIIFHGEVETASNFMNSHAIFVCPLFSGSGIRIKILEGMLMQRVVVSTTIAAEGLPVSPGRNIFIHDDPDNMLETIQELYHNRSLYEEVALEARQFIIENFNNFAAGKKLSDFYKLNLTCFR